METTICPWCQTEIVWDEEIGPEEECPHCHNELKGYRTINITLGDEEEEETEASSVDETLHMQHNHEEADDLWENEEPRRQGLKRPVVSGEETPDLMAYEAAVAKVQETQEQLPECPHCRQYMLLTGKQVIPGTGFKEHVPFGLKNSLMNGPVELNLYVCPACFHTSSFLSEQDRLKLVYNIQKSIS